MSITSRKALLRQREKGAVAIIVALSMLILMTAAALGVDIASLVYTRQKLRNSLDAAAQAGSYSLPDTDEARTRAKEYFKANFGKDLPNPTTNIQFYCVVASTGAGRTPNTTQVAVNCPAASSNATNATKYSCNTVMCAVVCPEGAASRCNTIKVTDTGETVKYAFGPTIGFPTGNTGGMSSAACRGTCGGGVPNPMNIVVVADRTPSMNNYSGAIASMKTGIKGMLQTMTQSQQYVAFGTIHKSDPDYANSSCPSTSDSDYTATTTTTGGRRPVTTTLGYKFNGSWMATPFSNTYNLSTTSSPGVYNPDTSSKLYKAVNCLAVSNYGHTHLASAMKGAARYLLGYDSNNISTLDQSGARANLGTPRNVIIFETDGAPVEDYFASSDGTVDPLTLSGNDYDIANSNAATACNNFKTIASAAKNAGVLIITIGFGAVNSDTCGTNGTPVRQVLAAASSPTNGVASQASACTDSTSTAIENSDGDNYFCGATGSDLASIFAAAFGSISGNTKLISIDGFSN